MKTLTGMAMHLSNKNIQLEIPQQHLITVSWLVQAMKTCKLNDAPNNVHILLI
jgi:hypothetical protein